MFPLRRYHQITVTDYMPSALLRPLPGSSHMIFVTTQEGGSCCYLFLKGSTWSSESFNDLLNFIWVLRGEAGSPSRNQPPEPHLTRIFCTSPCPSFFPALGRRPGGDRPAWAWAALSVLSLSECNEVRCLCVVLWSLLSLCRVLLPSRSCWQSPLANQGDAEPIA